MNGIISIAIKKGFREILLVLLVFAGLSGCQQELENRYLNPDKTTEGSIERFFAEMLNNDRVRPSYWEISTFVNRQTGIYTQSVGFLNNESIYQQTDSYIQDRWDDYYRPGGSGGGIMAHHREIEKAYASLTDERKQNAEVFIQAANVILYDQTSQMIDLWGDIPFSTAGMLNVTGQVVYPTFDDAAQLYDTLLNGLRLASHYFANASLTNESQLSFTKQDILLAGSLDRWRRYVNSLRMRLLMRISFVEESRARNEVMEILNDPSRYPLIDDGQYSPADDVLLQPLSDYTADLHDAFKDWTNFPAPYFMLEQVLTPANDPRIPVLFDKYGKVINNQFVPNSEYRGMPLDLTKTDQELNLGTYAILDSSTFLYNSKLPGIVITVAEVNFLKSEAFQRWGGGDAEGAYKEAIKQSIDFYYYLNTLNNNRQNIPVPTASDKDNFVNYAQAIQYAGSQEERLAKIWTQKWVHFGFMQSTV